MYELLRAKLLYRLMNYILGAKKKLHHMNYYMQKKYNILAKIRAYELLEQLLAYELLELLQ